VIEAGDRRVEVRDGVLSKRGYTNQAQPRIELAAKDGDIS
jgi:hypothetical protein